MPWWLHGSKNQVIKTQQSETISHHHSTYYSHVSLAKLIVSRDEIASLTWTTQLSGFKCKHGDILLACAGKFKCHVLPWKLSPHRIRLKQPYGQWGEHTYKLVCGSNLNLSFSCSPSFPSPSHPSLCLLRITSIIITHGFRCRCPETDFDSSVNLQKSIICSTYPLSLYTK